MNIKSSFALSVNHTNFCFSFLPPLLTAIPTRLLGSQIHIIVASYYSHPVTLYKS